MLHRSTSSRRRRASRSAASSPAAQNIRTSGTRSAATSPGRRASIAVSPIDGNRGCALIPPEMNRSPRHSIIPDISLMESREDRMGNYDIDGEGCNRSPRHSLVPDSAMSPRNSLIPDSQRSPRHSLVPNDLRSPRNSLVPDSALSPRNSLVPDQYNRSPRNSLVPDQNRTPRHSLTPESNTYGSRLNITEYNRSPRNSLLPDGSRTPRQVLTPSESATWNLEEVNRSPRHSITPETNRSPRGSITPEVLSHRTSPRGSISGEYIPDQRSPRGSIGYENGCDPNRSPRGSIAARNNLAADVRSSRGSLTLTFQEPPVSERRSSVDNPSSWALEKILYLEISVNEFKPVAGSSYIKLPKFIEDKKACVNVFNQDDCCFAWAVTSALFPATTTKPSRLTSYPHYSTVLNLTGSRGRNSSPSYRRSSRGNINVGYGGNSGFESSGSRRASSSVSQVGLPQVSGDEQRRLCADQKYSDDTRQGLGLGLSLTTYGSVAYQLKDANLEATGTCDFVCKALRIVNKTVIVTIILVCLSVLPLIMLIMGIQFLRDCPREPNIPIYMVVGGSVGCVKMGLTLWNQLHTRHLDASTMNATSIGSKVASVALTVLLITWFGLGNYWILRIKWPDYAPMTLFEPNKWCHRTLYVFALVHLCIVYTLVGVVIVLVIVLAFCQIFGCPWLGPARYK